MTADRLETACNEEIEVLALTVAERGDILQGLVDCPPGLGELRAVLLQDEAWRVRDGLQA